MPEEPGTPPVADPATPGSPRVRLLQRAGAGLLVSAAVAVGVLSWGAVSEKAPSSHAAGRTAAAEPATYECPTETRHFMAGTVNHPQRRLPDSFTPVAAVLCTGETRTTPGGGQYAVLVQKRATAGVDRLARELRKPDEPPPRPNLGCLAYADLVPWFVLVDASGEVIHPIVPTDFCQHALRDAMHALRDAGWTVVREQRLETILSDEAHKAGCQQTDFDAFASAVKPRAVGPGPAFYTRLKALNACAYSKPSAGAREGEFTSGGTLAGANLARVLSQLDGAPLAKSCPNRSRSFLVLRPAGVTTSVVVELDGCQRMIRENWLIVQLTPAQIAAVVAALPH